jgi:hypothetical protein
MDEAACGRLASSRIRLIVSTTAVLIGSQVPMAVSGVLAARALGPYGRGAVTAVLSWPIVLGWRSLVGLDTS